jgi:hypothetical protein
MSASLVALLLLVSPTVQETAPVEQQGPLADRARVDLGANAGILTIGWHARFEWAFSRWKAGELGVGVAFANYFHFLRDPRVDQEGVGISGADANINVAPTFGHTFWFAKRRVSLGLQVYPGLVIRNQRATITDEGNDFERPYRDTSLAFEAGGRFQFGVKVARHWGINLDAAVPFFVSGQSNLGYGWQVSSPYGGLSASYHF